MSYSFSVRGATKGDVVQKIVAELDKVVASQPVHAADRAQAQAAAENFLAILPADAGDKEFCVSVSGSVGWTGTDADTVVTSASVNVSASLVAKAA